MSIKLALGLPLLAWASSSAAQLEKADRGEAKPMKLRPYLNHGGLIPKTPSSTRYCTVAVSIANSEACGVREPQAEGGVRALPAEAPTRRLLVTPARRRAQSAEASRPEDFPDIDVATMGTGAVTRNSESPPADKHEDALEAMYQAALRAEAGEREIGGRAGVPNAAARCAAPLVNGNTLDGAFAPGENKARLTVQNDSDSFAFVKIIDRSQGLIRVMFLAKGGEGAIENIPDGSYDVKFAFGGWLLADCQTLTGTERAQEFETPVSMRTLKTVTETENEISTRWSASDVSVTLFPVPDGEAKTEKITLKAFNAD